MRWFDSAQVVERLGFIDRVVVFAWLSLTALMVLSYRSLDSGTWPARAVLLMIAVTWTHPVYSAFVKPVYANAFAAVIFAAVIGFVSFGSRRAGVLLLPALPWILAATIYTAARADLGLTRS